MGMTQQLLYSPQFHPFLEHQDGKRVPQHMRSNIYDTGLPCISLDDQPEALARQSLTMMIEEQRLLMRMALHQARACQFQVFLRGLYRNRGKWQETLTPAA